MSKFPGLAKWNIPTSSTDEYPSALQVIERNNVSLVNKTVLITGASSGIGAETVRAFASAGARVFVMVRSVEKARKVLDKISAEFPQHGGLEIIQCDLDSLASVNAAADEFLTRSDKLNILVNNAGICWVPHALTIDGMEMHLAVNHVAHHLLFKKVAQLMIKSSTPEFHSRVVTIASNAHLWGQLDFADPNYTQGREYTPPAGYFQSKLANVWFANQVDKLYGSQGVHAVCLHPGLVATEGLYGIAQPLLIASGMFTADGDYALDVRGKSADQGAATSVWAATSPELEGKGGLYLEDTSIAKPNVAGTMSGYSAAAFDEVQAAKLWDWSEKQVAKYVQA